MSRTFNFIENFRIDQEGNIVSKIDLLIDGEVVNSIEGLNTNDNILNLKDAWLSLN